MNTQVSFNDDDLLYSQRYDDHYYSRSDGRAECAHVFLKGNDLPERWRGAETFTIGELGFGTGLNLLETWRQWCEVRQDGQQLVFVSLEKFKLDRDIVERALARWIEVAPLAKMLLSQWDSLGLEMVLDPQTKLHVHLGEADEALLKFPMVDAWYLDGFSPAKNPDMWSQELMTQLGRKTSSGGTCASYTAAGWVRRNLEAAGFEIEKRPGFGTKRDMIAGRYLGPAS